MRKLTHALIGKHAIVYGTIRSILCLLFCLPFYIVTLNSQCTPIDQTISGSVYYDNNSNGIFDTSENGQGGILVLAYDANNALVGQTTSSSVGDYAISDLLNGQPYRLEFFNLNGNADSYLVGNNGSSVQFREAPFCEADFTILDPTSTCSANPEIVLTCFVQDDFGINGHMPTIVSVEHDFGANSLVKKYATAAETGSVWGLDISLSQASIYSSAFVKQYSAVTPHGIGAIFTTSTGSNPSTTLFADLTDVGELTNIDVNDCDYGNQVGRVGLGGLALSNDEADLYVVNIANNTLVKVPTSNPNPSNTIEYAIPDPGCSDGDTRSFALNNHNGKFYVGVTCTAETSQDENNSSIHVYEFNPSNTQFTLVFSTDYAKGYWYDNPTDGEATMHWLTDIDFTDEGLMLLSLSDRIGHRFCNNGNGRLDKQNPDLLIAWDNNGTWTLESNGTAGTLAGSGQNNGQGPGGGEFFGFDFWPSGANYHPETALGSIYVLPGSGQVISTNYDPHFNSYSGGLHRYYTSNGSKASYIELYVNQFQENFGKATGFGDLSSLCPPAAVEIGNYVWEDSNSNGVQDAGELALGNVDLNLYDQDCNLVGSTTTDTNGNYVFNNGNVDLDGDGIMDGLLSNATYYVVLDNANYNPSMQNYSIGGEDYMICSSNIGMGTNADLNDSDAALFSNICDQIDGSNGIIVNTLSSGANHNFDIGVCKMAQLNFDAALFKEVVGNPTARIGDEVTFKITVVNQGQIPASKMTIIDHIPSGFNFDSNSNPGWTYNGSSASAEIYNLGIGESQELFIKLVVNGQSRDFLNIAEISAALDDNGDDLEDVDSTPDNDPANDSGGEPGSLTDDEINDDGTLDEDDHDPATIQIFDLALRKEVSNPLSFYQIGDLVEYTIRIFNQGNVEASDIEIVEYIPDGFSFDANLNPNWILDGNGNVIALLSNNLAPGESTELTFVLQIPPSLNSSQVINEAEIAAATPVGTVGLMDWDSTPDRDNQNDEGGSPFDNTDNLISDQGTTDEDDHDPALILVDRYDLALIKSVNRNGVERGEDLVYDITVYNQGTITANDIRIVDYVPDYLEPTDSAWEQEIGAVPTKYKRTIELPNGLQPGESHTITISFKVDPNAPAIPVINRAEIYYSEDNDGNDFSSLDADSTPDMIIGNDLGGIPNSPNSDDVVNAPANLDEDDEDPAVVFVIDSEIATECICLNNATTSMTGQFSDEILVTGPSSQTWYIQNVIGLSDYTTPSNAVPNNTIGSAGFMLEEIIVLGNGMSVYMMIGVHDSGEGYTIQLTNGEGNFQNLTNAGCSYTAPNIVGPASVCTNAIMEYSTDPIVGVTFDWELNGVAVGSGETVEIDFAGLTGAQIVTVIPSGSSCYEPVSVEVVVGTVNGVLACVGSVNITLNNDCEATITPAMLLTSPIIPGAAYGVILTDEYGNPIVGNTVDGSYIGQTLMAKIMDGCSGNSCWSFVTVEDKTPPEIFCEDIEITCNEMLHYEGPLAIDNCDGVVQVDIVEHLVTPLDCDVNHIKQIDRTYRATDNFGNVAFCNQVILVKRLDLNIVQFPDNVSMGNMNALTCGTFDLDKFGFPATSETGVPTIDGDPVYPSSHFYCNLSAGYTDEILSSNACVTKILRTWLVAEWWCNGGGMMSHEQLIEIVDDQDPVITCPANMTQATSGFTCMANVNLPMPTVSDVCSPDDLTIAVTHPNGFIADFNGGVISLPIGTHTVTYTVYDKCLNSSSCNIEIDVVDQTAPIAICDQNTVVGLNSTGIATVYAPVFDDGSYDDCHLESMDVLRMDAPSSCNSPVVYGDHVIFCCEDVGQTIQVLFRVTDMSGNQNTCMVNVEVQDKFAPSITCPPNMGIDCGDLFDLTDEDQMNQMFGTATATDACQVNISSTASASLDQCGVGTITRTFTASDANGSASCTQVITITNPEPFVYGDIDWPDDYETQLSCLGDDFDPDNLPTANAYPTWSEDQCDLVGATYEDQVFLVEPDNNSCFKILRRWSVIDWCQYDGVNGFWTWDQTIVVSNFIAPTIVGGCDDIEVCTFDPECAGGHVDLIFEATDDCTPDDMLMWSYVIDLNNDGTADISNSGTGAMIDVSGTYDLGMHSIIWLIEDRCGNTMSCTKNFTIINCKPPTAYCINGLSIGLVPMDLDGDGVPDAEMAELCVESVDNGSYHSCGYDVDLSFSADVDDDCIVFDCSDLGPQIIQLWVTDINGNTTFCETTIDVQDNNETELCNKIDLALINELDDYDAANQVATFNITVCNQGNTVVNKVDVAAYIPAGYALNDADWNSLVNGDAVINLMSSDGSLPVSGLAPGDCFTIPITLNVLPNMDLTEYVLYAEIIGGMDATGLMASDDCDSTPASNTPDENSVNPGDPDDNNPNGGGPDAGEDEDDHDPAQIPIYDLSLIKVITNSGPYVVGSVVDYDIIVTNQGNQTAMDIEVVDYIPCGMSIDLGANPGWAIDFATFNIVANIPGPLAPGQSVPVSISLNVNNIDPNCQGDNYVNFAEINSFTDTDGVPQPDFDSDPDSDPDNDGPVNDDVTDNSGGDEDDHDPAEICPVITMPTETAYCSNEIDVLVASPSGGLWSGVGIVDPSTGSFDASLVNGDQTTITYTIQAPNCVASIVLDIVDLPNLILTTPAPVCNIGTSGMTTIIDFTQLTNIGTGTWVDTDNSNVDLSDLSNVDFTGVTDGTYTFTFTTNITNTPCPDVTASIEVQVLDCNCSCLAAANSPECLGDDIALFDNGINGASWSWTGPNGFTSTLQNPVITGATMDDVGLFELTTTCDNGVSQSCQILVEFTDDEPPVLINCPGDISLNCEDLPEDLSTLGVASGIDNCDGALDAEEIVTMNVNSCNTGFIVRTFIVTDFNNNSAQCTQLITINSLGSELMMDDIVVQPDTIVVMDCSTIDPDVIGGTPVINGGNDMCYNVSVDFDDSPMNPSLPLCMDTIDRVWTVVDSCQLNGDGMTGIFTFNQAIVVQDDSGPVIMVPDSISLPCDATSNFVNLVAVVTDCDPNPSITNNAPVGNGMEDASGNYTADETIVTFTATDACGNVTTAQTVVLLDQDTEAPTFNCKKTFVNIDDSGTVTVVADSSACNLMDNCTDTLDLLVYFVDQIPEIPGDPFVNLGTMITFDCDDLSPNVAVNIGVEDEAGNVSFCQTAIAVLDPNGFCDMIVNVTGEFRTASDNPIENTQVELDQSTMPMTYSNDNGYYAFENLDLGADYNVVPTKDVDHLDGVSTLDLVLIQKYLLGNLEFESPYYYIAADINKSNSISSVDLVELRKLILGIYTEFPNNTSWRMIDKGFTFPNGINPLDMEFPESYQILDLTNDMIIDFVGVKVGDVNGNASENIGESIVDQRQTLELFYDDKDISKGERVQIELWTNQSLEISGLQLYLKHPGLELKGLSSNSLDLNSNNWNIDQNGHSRISWNTISDDLNIASGEFITLEFEAKSNVRLSEVVNVVETQLKSEIYTDSPVVPKRISLQPASTELFSVQQNRPNPWLAETAIAVKTMDEGEAEIRITDMLGRLVFSKKVYLQKGGNEIILKDEDLNKTGLFLYSITKGKTSLTKQMIKI